jgi:ankyrin repeat protein
MSHAPRSTALDLLPSKLTLLEKLRDVLTDPDYKITSLDFLRMMHTAAANGIVDALKLILAVHQPAKHMLELQRAGMFASRVVEGSRRQAVQLYGTILHTAVQHNHHKCVRLLLEYNSKMDIISLTGQMPLHLAAISGDNDILKLLLSHSSDVNARNAAMETPLFLATESGHLSTMRILLNRGADATVVNVAGQTLYHAAGLSSDRRVLSSVVETGLRPSDSEVCHLYWRQFRECLMHAGMRECLTTATIFVDPWLRHTGDNLILKIVPLHFRRLNLTISFLADKTTVLYTMAIAGDVGWVAALLKAGAMINQRGGKEGTPLMGACKAGRVDVVKCLVGNGALVEYSDNGVQVSAFAKAQSYPGIQRWLLVERFTEQRTILNGQTHTSDHEPKEATNLSQDTRDLAGSDGTFEPTTQLILDVDQYLTSINWFLPTRRFVDRGDGAFDLGTIDPSDFPKFQPDYIVLEERTGQRIDAADG